MGLTFEPINGSDATFDKENVTIVRKYRARNQLPVSIPGGTDYFDTVASAAMTWVAANAATSQSPMGTLYWNSIQLHENYYALSYAISVTYGRTQKATGAYQITVNQSGGTVHVTSGRRIAGYGPAKNKVDHGGLIGVDGDKVAGTDIPVDQTKLSVMFRHPEGQLNRAYLRNIGRLVGYPNKAAFLDYEPGEVLYMGSNATETDTEASAAYSFKVSYNRKNFKVGGILIAEKAGWDIISPTYEDAEEDGHGVRKVKYLEIIRPAGREWQDYGAFGWGS